jgi:predicted transcriptional regulator
MKKNNQNAAKPESEKVWNKGRITVDLGTEMKGRLLSYAKHEKRTMKQIVMQALADTLEGREM